MSRSLVFLVAMALLGSGLVFIRYLVPKVKPELRPFLLVSVDTSPPTPFYGFGQAGPSAPSSPSAPSAPSVSSSVLPRLPSQLPLPVAPTPLAGSPLAKYPGTANDGSANDGTANNSTLPSLSFGACCGIGHRLNLNLKTLVHAYNTRTRATSQKTLAHWTDVPWSQLFLNNSLYVEDGGNRPVQKSNFYGNGYPKTWTTSPGRRHDGTVADLYRDSAMFDLPSAQQITKSLRDNLSPTVLNFLDPLRAEYREVHLCAHLRVGNNETGDWQSKSWRHVEMSVVRNGTLEDMKKYVSSSGTSPSKVSVYVASDDATLRPWFAKAAPPEWTVLSSSVAPALPASGVWFGEHGSKTSAGLSQEEKNLKMAEAVADVFALGECSALWVPTYSSFTYASVTLARGEGRDVRFRAIEGVEFKYF